MSSFCLLTSVELILITNCSSFYLEPNDLNIFKTVFFGGKIKAISFTTLQINSVCSRRGGLKVKVIYCSSQA